MLKVAFTYLARGLALIVIIFLCYAWWASHQARYYQTELGPEIKQKFGFSTGTPVIRAGTQSVEVLTVYPEAGGLLDKAGFEEGDIVLSASLTKFYRLLHESTDTLEFEVVPGGDGAALAQRTKRTIEVPVPER